jgi:hypothetical protein
LVRELRELQMNWRRIALDATAKGVGAVAYDKGMEAAYRGCADQLDVVAVAASAYIYQPGAVSDETWRCFHCDEVFTSHQSAKKHFGTSERHSPACAINITEYRRMEAASERYIAEDTELHREIYRLQSAHSVALKRTEEEGYAKGLAAAPPQASSGDALDAARLNFLEANELDLRVTREPSGLDKGMHAIWWQVCKQKRSYESVSGHPLGSPRDAIDAAMHPVRGSGGGE